MKNKLQVLKSRLTLDSIHKSFVVAKQTFLGHTAKYPKVIDELEKGFCDLVGTNHSLSFGNGTSAFEAILFALNIQKGDKVLLSRLTFYSVVLRLKRLGANIEFLDFDNNLQVRYTDEMFRDTKLIVVSHLFGFPQKMNYLKQKQSIYGFKIIEDCSHSHGAKFASKSMGSFGDASFFSLQGTKPISAGEGGMVCTNSKQIYNALRIHSHMGRNNDEIKVPFALRQWGYGSKSRLHPLGAGLALIDLKKIERRNKKIKKNVDSLINLLDGNDIFQLIVPVSKGEFGGGYFGYPVWVKISLLSKLNEKQSDLFTNLSYPNYLENEIFTEEIFEYDCVCDKYMNAELFMFKEERIIDNEMYMLKFIKFEYIEAKFNELMRRLGTLV